MSCTWLGYLTVRAELGIPSSNAYAVLLGQKYDVIYLANPQLSVADASLGGMKQHISRNAHM